MPGEESADQAAGVSWGRMRLQRPIRCGRFAAERSVAVLSVFRDVAWVGHEPSVSGAAPPSQWGRGRVLDR